MSTSRDNLPAVGSTHDRLEVVEVVLPELDKRTRKTLGDVRIIIALALTTVAALFGGGWKAFAQVRETAAEVAQVEAGKASEANRVTAARVDQLEHTLKELRAEVQDNTDETKGLRKDLRKLFPALPPMATDGGR